MRGNRRQEIGTFLVWASIVFSKERKWRFEWRVLDLRTYGFYTHIYIQYTAFMRIMNTIPTTRDFLHIYDWCVNLSRICECVGKQVL